MVEKKRKSKRRKEKMKSESGVAWHQRAMANDIESRMAAVIMA